MTNLRLESGEDMMGTNRFFSSELVVPGGMCEPAFASVAAASALARKFQGETRTQRGNKFYDRQNEVPPPWVALSKGLRLPLHGSPGGSATNMPAAYVSWAPGLNSHTRGGRFV